jgi:hypothetical protein
VDFEGHASGLVSTLHNSPALGANGAWEYEESKHRGPLGVNEPELIRDVVVAIA